MKTNMDNGTPQAITEEMKVYEDWYNASVTKDELISFLHHLMNDYEHDYGTVIHAFAAAMIATSKVMLDEPQGGLSGFQHSAVAWQVMIKMLHINGPVKLVKFEDMLYPQYNYHFNKTMSADTFKWLQEQAQSNLLNKSNACDEVIAHWQSIANGQVPFGYKIKDD